LHEPAKVKGGHQLVLAQRGNPTNSFRAFARFEGREALSNFAIAIGIVFSIVDASFIDKHNLVCRFCLQTLLERLALEFVPFTVAVSFFSDSPQSFSRHH
jgi:hypothetical protein